MSDLTLALAEAETGAYEADLLARALLGALRALTPAHQRAPHIDAERCADCRAPLARCACDDLDPVQP